MLPYWYDAIVPDLRAGKGCCVAAHGNSLRALVKHLDDISDEAIAELNIPTGIPLRLRPRRATAPGRPGRHVPRPGRREGRRRRGRQPGPLTQLDTGSAGSGAGPASERSASARSPVTR